MHKTNTFKGISSQFKFSNEPIPPPEPKPKDLLYFSTTWDKSGLTRKFVAADPDTGDDSSSTATYQSVIVEEGIWIPKRETKTP